MGGGGHQHQVGAGRFDGAFHGVGHSGQIPLVKSGVFVGVNLRSALVTGGDGSGFGAGAEQDAMNGATQAGGQGETLEGRTGDFAVAHLSEYENYFRHRIDSLDDLGFAAQQADQFFGLVGRVSHRGPYVPAGGGILEFSSSTLRNEARSPSAATASMGFFLAFMTAGSEA